MLVRYYGNITGQSGYADAAREFCMSLLTAADGIDLEITCPGGHLAAEFLPLASRVRDQGTLSPNPDVVIVHTLPLSCAELLVKEGLQSRRFQDSYSDTDARLIAYTTWEGCGAISPAVAQAMSRFDEVWVPSRTNQVDFAGPLEGIMPVSVVPHAYDPDSLNSPWGPDDLPDPKSDEYSFYYIGAWNARKNVDGLIRAYLRAFMDTEAHSKVRLSIHSAGASPSAVSEAVVKATGRDPMGCPWISVSDRWATDEDIYTLHRRRHCYVTATRGEGWNLPAFHAMLAGNHVIAPLGMGHGDFLRETSASLYSATPAPSHADLQFVGEEGGGKYRAQYIGPQGMTCKDDWLEPDLNELAVLMRAAYYERTTDITLRYDPKERYSRQAVGRRIRDLLDHPPTIKET